MKRIAFFCFLLATLAVALAVASPQPEAQASQPLKSDIWAPFKDTVTVKLGRAGAAAPPYVVKGDTINDNVYMRWIKDRYNIKVEYSFWAPTEYNTKVAVVISSGDLPDFLQVTSQDQMTMLLESDMVQDLTNLIPAYSSDLVKDIIKSHGGIEKAYRNTTFNGKIRALRQFDPAYQYNMVWIRQDWLKKVGADAPTTMADLEAVARKFVAANLGGKGTTVGIEIDPNMAGVYNQLGYADPVFGAFKAFPRQWYPDKNGNIVYGSLTDETKQALAFLAKWYAAGLIDREFATKDMNASIAAGYSGITFGPWWVSVTALRDSMKNDSQAMWIPIAPILNKDGIYNVFNPNTEPGWGFIRAKYKNPEAVMMLQNLSADVTTLAREPITNFTSQRPPELIAVDAYPPGMWNSWPYPLGVQYFNAQVLLSRALVKAVEDNQTKGFPPTTLADVKSIQSYLSGGTKDLAAWSSAVRYQAKKFMVNLDDTKKLSELPNFFPRTTESMKLQWADLLTLEKTTFQKIIMGQQSVDSFGDFVNAWMKQGGQNILNEVNKQYRGK